ncbi:hypothetical protein K458DRAFT_386686 [Lentithecium fluviatile CBS 122367]|uniref:DUF7779 domain-containing protein n=1 Tax=Lentithecium fluviatile CBS 122367 TaxID=1168545 RepID=A0A6G1J8I3_9PLEO|nr:hypothetical protein K458DRAFT_386686 [Lentithecium fluviatile CBS 122367]
MTDLLIRAHTILANAHPAPNATALLRVLSMLDGDSIPEEILTKGTKKVGLQNYPSDKPAYFKAHNKSLNEVNRLWKVQRYQPQVSQLRSVLEKRGVEDGKPSLSIEALFNESSWTYQLYETGYGFSVGDEYAVLAQRIVEDSDSENDRLKGKILADSYRFQGIIGSYLDTPKGMSYTKQWVELLVDRTQKYQLKEDIHTLPIAYNEYGRALMRVPDKKEALRSWGIAKSIILPILEDREKKLGKDDTDTYETGMILTCMGHVRRAQGKMDESFSLNQRAGKVVPVATEERSMASLTAYYRLAVDEFDRDRFERSSVGLYHRHLNRKLTSNRKLLEKIVTFIGEDQWFKSVAARADWKLGRTLMREGGNDNEDEAQILLERAMRIRHELVPDDDRKEEDLTDADWDNIVFYLFR